MLTMREPVSLAARAQLDSHLLMTSHLVDKSVDSIEQLSELHINLARVTFEQSHLVVRQFIAAENLQQVLALAAEQAKPNTRRMLDYAYYLTTIASRAQEEAIKVAGTRMADSNRRAIELLQEFGRLAPYAIKAAAAVLRSLVDSMHLGLEEATRAAQRNAAAVNAGADAALQQAARAAIRSNERRALGG